MSNDITVLTNLPDDYHAQRLRYWNQNARFWAKYVDSDEYRLEMLKELVNKVSDHIKDIATTPKIVDFGCGEGQFLRLLYQQMPRATFHGIDSCESMIKFAKERTGPINTYINFELGDIESANLKLASDQDLAIAIMTLDEIPHLSTPLSNIAAALRPGGIAIIVVLEPLVEILRHIQEIFKNKSKEKTIAEEGLLIIKHFRIGQQFSPAPYNRIVRPIATYIGVALQHNLKFININTWPNAIENRNGKDPVFNALFFRKS